MKISNHDNGDGQASAFSRIAQLQGELQSRLLEETMKYVQKLRAPLAPSAPGTVLRPFEGLELEAEAEAGGEFVFSVSLENRQRAHTMVAPYVTCMLREDGTAWYPERLPPLGSVLIPPRGSEEVEVRLGVPAELPPGEYRGALILLGFRENAIPLRVVIS